MTIGQCTAIDAQGRPCVLITNHATPHAANRAHDWDDRPAPELWHVYAKGRYCGSVLCRPADLRTVFKGRRMQFLPFGTALEVL